MSNYGSSFSSSSSSGLDPILPPGMKHVERKELYTSLPKRLHYLQTFIEWGQGKPVLDPLPLLFSNLSGFNPVSNGLSSRHRRTPTCPEIRQVFNTNCVRDGLQQDPRARHH